MSFGVTTCEVQFVGGPLDGCHEVIPRKPESLASVIAIPINANLLLALEGRPRGARLPATSVAVYELHVTTGNFRYQFVGPTTARQLHLEHWTG